MARHRLLLLVAALLAPALGWQVWLAGQQPAARTQPASNRFEFEVIQSYDARYQGDTPGHMGRSGGLENRKLQVALGDPVFRGEQQVGKVTGLGWSRPHGSLEVEFDPLPAVRVCVGDSVWIALDGQKPAVSR
ncbi:MAG TPA: hypothetical protein VFB80_22890 [Pirellulaceae bacterium]|nr:hypothetical protein [Pirellulaceae bacterium]